VERSGRSHDAARRQWSLRGFETVGTLAGGHQASHGGVFLDGRTERSGIPLEVRDIAVASLIAIRIVAVVVKPGKLRRPIGRQQRDRIPSFIAPALSDIATLQDHVLDAAFLEAIAHGQTGVTAADHDRVDAVHFLKSPRKRRNFTTRPRADRLDGGRVDDARASVASEPAERSERRSGERATL
jgi:hypothetical protein